MALYVITTAAFSQRCFTIKTASLSPLNTTTNSYTLAFTYETTGNKALETKVYCNNQLLVTYCLVTNTNSGYQEYPIPTTTCGGAIKVSFTPYTGSCGAAQCAFEQTLENGLLPVKLNSFSAIRSKQFVSLTWNTEFEIDSKEFVVERAGGTTFRSIGTISSNGNSTAQISYTFNDKNENTFVTYYRLRNVDVNGNFTYSEIKTVKGLGAATDVTVFPNPARINSKISIIGATSNSSIQLIDFSGKVIRNLNGNTNNSIDLSGVQNGTYLIRIVDKITNEFVNKKLTINN